MDRNQVAEAAMDTDSEEEMRREIEKVQRSSEEDRESETRRAIPVADQPQDDLRDRAEVIRNPQENPRQNIAENAARNRGDYLNLGLLVALLVIFISVLLALLGQHFHGIRTEIGELREELIESRAQMKNELRRFEHLNNKCPEFWIHFEETDSCYYYQNFTRKMIADSKLFAWQEAEDACQAMHSHLVSIHSEAELKFLQRLVRTNLNALTPEDKPINHCSISKCANHVFVGAHYIDGQWSWSDETSIDYLTSLGHAQYYKLKNWPLKSLVICYDGPDLETSKGYARGLDIWSNGRKFPRYVCKRATKY